MPNHIHILLEINSTKISGLDVKIKSLSSIIGALKTTSSKEIHLKGLNDFSWQRSFHDHIVKNEPSYLNIDNYISLNAENWYKDTFFNQN
jgi:REP element-mobilizing transposase RayT